MNTLFAIRCIYVLTDLALIFGFVYFSDAIQVLFGSQSIWYALLLLFLVNALGIALIGYGNKKDRINKFQFALVGLSATGFGILNIYISLEIIGLDSLDVITTTGITFLSILWITTLAVYMVGVLPRTTATAKELQDGTATKDELKTESVEDTTSVLRTLLIAVLSTIAIVITSAYWEFKLFDPTSTIASTSEKITTMLWTYPLFFLFFASPRLLTLTKKISWYTATSALLSIGYIVWHSIL